MASIIQNNVERWLVHEGLKFNYHKPDDNHAFKVVINGPAHVQDIDTEVFEPAKQLGVIVIGRKCPFGTNQNKRYLNMSESEQKKMQERIAEYCNSIGVVHRFLIENGRSIVGIYIVIDSKEKQNQVDFSEALRNITNISDTVKDHIRRNI